MPRSRAPRLTVGLVALLMAGFLPVPPARAASVHQTARVTKVVDGDTVKIDLDGDGITDADVRLLGIDTPEIGNCGSYVAKRKLRSLLDGKRIDLYADSAASKDPLGRLPRRITVVRNGKTLDATKWMLMRGLGPWMPHPTEHTNNLLYHTAADTAAAAGLRFFDPVRCARGPVQNSPLEIQAQWQPDTADGVDRLYEEFIRVTNKGAKAINISGWIIRTGGVRTLHVPGKKSIAPGRTLTIHVGKGTNRRYHRFLGRSGPLLINANLDGGPHMGDGVYLVDPDWDLRAHQTWPCTIDCADPTGGNLSLTVNQDPPGRDSDNINGEWLKITNNGASSIHTGNLVIEASPYYYELPPGHWLGPGKTLTVRAGHGTDSHLVRYLGADKPVLNNDGDRVLVRTYDAIVIACDAWGSVSCP